MRAFAVAFFLAGMAAAGAEPGVLIVPSDEGVFEYADDFETPRVFRDAFLSRPGADCWMPGGLVNSGPGSTTVTYRFHGDCAIKALAVQVDQMANARHLGGLNTLLLSTNGLDWQTVASTRGQPGDANEWQREPLTVAGDQTAKFAGGTELWVRLVLRNYSGLKTAVSNRIDALTVRLELGDPAGPDVDPQAQACEAWGRLRREAQWRALVLDCADPVGERPPHYYEDTDGWLEAAGANPHLPNGPDGFHIGRTYRDGERCALSLAVFIAMRESASPVMAKVTVRGTSGSHRALKAYWDGREVAEFDMARYFEADRDFYVTMAGPRAAGVHELRLAGADAGRVALIRRVEVVGEGIEGWAEQPPLARGGSVEILSAYYMPDPAPPAASQVVEGRQEGMGLTFAHLQRFYKEHAEFGAIRVLFRNNGAVPVRIANALHFNGRPIEAAYVDFTQSPWDARGVVWYRVRPRTLAPGECGQAYIRFRRRPEGDSVTVTLGLENGDPATATILYASPEVVVDYVTTGKDGRTLYVYARRLGTGEAQRVESVTLDGRLLEDALLYGAGFPGNVALAVAQLGNPLEEGSYHVAGIRTDDGVHIASQFRVLPFFFPRSSIHVPVELAKSMHMNLLTWRMHGLETCQEHGLPTTCMHSEVLHVHERVPLIFAPDEPDAKDNRGGGYDRGLGWYARMLEHSGWQELVARQSPPVASWMNMDGTTRPLNWGVYGQFGDVNGFDPYPINFYGADHAYVRESLGYVRRCCAPTRMYAILEAFGWGKGQGVPKGARGPSPAEYRQNLVQAIGAGMKGLTSWVHSAGAGGWALDAAAAAEIAKMNGLLEHIEDELLTGTPIDLATCDAGQVPTGTVGKELWPKERVWVGTLLCGPDALVVVAVNHIPASKPDPPVIEPAKDVTITVTLPEFLPEVTAYEAGEQGMQPYPCEVTRGQAVLQLDTLVSGRVFVLRHVL